MNEPHCVICQLIAQFVEASPRRNPGKGRGLAAAPPPPPGRPTCDSVPLLKVWAQAGGVVFLAWRDADVAAGLIPEGSQHALSDELQPALLARSLAHLLGPPAALQGQMRQVINPSTHPSISCFSRLRGFVAQFSDRELKSRSMRLACFPR